MSVGTDDTVAMESTVAERLAGKYLTFKLAD